MNILIIGNGGREHALAWKCAQSPLAGKIYVAPGNAGTAQEFKCQNVDIPVNDTKALVQFALENDIELTIVGPEQPLILGIVKTFELNGLKILGPSYRAAMLEGSKAFAKRSMDRSGIPNAPWYILEINEHLEEILQNASYPFVIKADHPCAGKGVLIAHSPEEAIPFIEKLRDGSQCGSCTQHVLIEELVKGTEVSFICVIDKNGFVLPMASSQDHKARDNEGKGPNTGGMGAYSPSPIITPELHSQIISEVIRPTVDGMKEDGSPFVGFLYAGLMIGDDGSITVLEYNVRMGDPETQPILMRLKSDLVELCLAAVNGTLDKYEIEWDERPALGIVLAATGYPNSSYEKGYSITGLDVIPDDIKAFHAGTTLDESGNVIGTGSRVLCITTLSEQLSAARGKIYGAIELIHSGDNLFCRTDIGAH